MYKKFVKFVYALKFKMNARRFANKIRGAMVELSDCGFSDGINGRMPIRVEVTHNPRSSSAENCDPKQLAASTPG